MFQLGLGHLIVLFPLILAFVIVFRHGNKTRKVRPWTPDETADMKTVGKALVYTFASLILIWISSTFGVIETITGLILASFMAILIVICVVELPDSLDMLDDLAWRDGPKDPWRPAGAKPTPYVRWARRASLVVLMFFLFVVAMFNAIHPVTTSSGATGSGIFTTAPAPTTQSTTPAPAPTPQATTPTPTATATGTAPTQFVTNNCSGPAQIPTVDHPSTVPFGTGNLQICYNGRWQKWSSFSTTSAPASVQITAWVINGTCNVGQGVKHCAYGQAVDTATGDAYVIRTTAFTTS